MKFKVGDRVTGKNSFQYAYKKVYTISNIIGGRIVLEGEPQSFWEKGELVLTKDNPIYPKFNMGDRVKWNKVGRILTIKSIAPSYKVEEEDFTFFDDEIELYVEPKTEELTLKQVCKELGRDIKIVK